MKNMIIEGPVFKGEEDENIFFQCIYNLPDFKEVVGAGTELTITFSATVSETAKEQIAVLCRRWNTTLCS
jgi:hypothetical protein